ncbi:oxidoreductase [Sphaerisporangium krabiense]|uniref:Nitroreductase n=1 Tax=Sphaerisporangium krabiense TaxID=763782 RepID=A0A7W8YZI8_9ACTN|nr:nitroreductase family protein [Sphaerisporangium krabiense]MBB5624702.1 nitroreductase [Sphaerisporangium krabiense]GII61338.1 oxidoreductase [Sphaerisporangium krabiense]
MVTDWLHNAGFPTDEPAFHELTPDGLLTTTRSVRRRLDLNRPVPRELIEECLRIAQQAPCGSGRNTGHWIVITDPGIRASIGALYRTAFEHNASAATRTAPQDRAAQATARPGDPAQPAARPAESQPPGTPAETTASTGERPASAGGLEGSRKRSLDSAAYLARHLGEVPVLVLACLRTGEDLPDGNQAGLWGSLLPSVWSFMLAARARGLGTTWTTVHLRHERAIADLLGIPSGVHQAALIPTAYHLGETFRPALRPPLPPTVHHDRW